MHSTTINLLQAIITKGGIIGYAAKMYLHDESLARKFILECSEQCHNKQAIDFWGEELVETILKYKNISNSKTQDYEMSSIGYEGWSDY